MTAEGPALPGPLPGRGRWPAQVEFRDFMAARWPALVRLGYGLTGDQGLAAEDLAQTALVKAYALRQLPDRQQAVVVLRYWLDLTEAQVADTLGCSAGTVKSQAPRALAKLRLSPELAGGGAL